MTPATSPRRRKESDHLDRPGTVPANANTRASSAQAQGRGGCRRRSATGRVLALHASIRRISRTMEGRSMRRTMGAAARLCALLLIAAWAAPAAATPFLDVVDAA